MHALPHHRLSLLDQLPYVCKLGTACCYPLGPLQCQKNGQIQSLFAKSIDSD